MAVPPATPATIPVEPTVAMPVLPLLQTPPDVRSERVVVARAQTVPAPVTEPAEGAALTVTTTVEYTVAHGAVTI